MEHVAGHLEAISLFALPSLMDEYQPGRESSGALSSLGAEEDDLFYSMAQAEFTTPLYPLDTANPPPHTKEGYATAIAVPESDQYSSKESAGSMVFTCDECPRVFDQVHKLKYNIPSPSHRISIIVDLLLVEVYRLTKIISHHKRYHERHHPCTYPGCGKRFSTKTHLERHINDKHLIQRKYHCSEADCPYSKAGGRSFPRKDNWRRHMQNKHGMDRSAGFEIPSELIEEPEPEP